MVNRDSLVLKVLLLLSVILGVLASVTDPTLYGLDPVRGAVVLNYIKLASVLVAAVTGWLQTSPLKGENDEAKVKKGPWMVLLPLLLAGGLAASCAGLTPAPVSPDPTEAQVQATRAKAIEIAKAVESVGNLVVEARRSASAAHAVGLITRAQLDAVNQAVIDLEPKAHAVIDIAATVTTDPQLRSTVSALMAVMDDFLAKLAEGNEAMRTVAASIRTALQVASIYLGGAR